MNLCHTHAFVVRRALCGVRGPSTFKNNYSNIFFFKTTGLQCLNFTWNMTLLQGLRIVNIGLGRISKMAPVTKKKQK